MRIPLRFTLFSTTLATLLLVLPAPAAPDELDAREVFRRAVRAQGELKAEVRDITLTFEGEVAKEGGSNTVRQTYWYRVKDRSFRVHTGSGATNKLKTDRGVLGKRRYWERSPRGKVIELRGGNREDAASIKTIRADRERFERILRLVLLARMDDDWKISFAAPEPVKLGKDHPYNAASTLDDRSKVRYHVLNAEHEGEARLQLYVRADDYTVRKVIQFHKQDPHQVEWVYYFGPFRRDPELGLTLPLFLSVYTRTPFDGPSRQRNLSVKGQPTVRINTGLADEDLFPGEPTPPEKEG